MPKNNPMDDMLYGGAAITPTTTRQNSAQQPARGGYAIGVGRPMEGDRKTITKKDGEYVQVQLTMKKELFLKYKALARQKETATVRVLREALDFAMKDIERRTGEIRPLEENGEPAGESIF